MPRRFSIARPARNYAEMTHASPWWVVRYPHRRRLRLATELLLRDRPRLLIDYGAGDGEMIAMMAERGLTEDLDLIVAYDPVEQMVELSRARLEPLLADRVAVCGSIADVDAALGGRSADAVACLEVLEHLSLDERRHFYEFCRERLGPGGVAVIDVPVEVGPSLLVKQVARRLLKGSTRRHERGELLPKLLGRQTVDPERFAPDHPTGWINDHHGFDHRVFRDELERSLEVTETYVSPLAGPAWLNQEIFFLARAPG